MAQGEASCENCVGVIRELCHEAFRQESGLIKMVQAMDAEDVCLVQQDPSATDERLQEVEEAAQLESVHFVDYRSQELARNMSDIGCTLSRDETKEKLIIRMAGI